MFPGVKIRSKNVCGMAPSDYVDFIITISVGFVIVVGLTLCYCYVFRKVCCLGRPKKPQTNRQTGKRESISMKFLNDVSSQPTELSVA
ncbi:hypothetical protein JTB14_033554 [Gonioctena quinquepunctata]|nr:hypothetical protein JTB14_033554 [Gonioctena quinquepunctata]